MLTHTVVPAPMEKDSETTEFLTDLEWLVTVFDVKRKELPEEELPAIKRAAKAKVQKGKLFPSEAKFGFGLSPAALNSWVKQPSPCCAAASVSGALNVVRGTDKEHPGRLDLQDSLQVLQRMIARQLEAKRTALKHLLRCSAGTRIECVEEQVIAALRHAGKRLDASKKRSPDEFATDTDILSALDRAVKNHMRLNALIEAKNQLNITGGLHTPPAYADRQNQGAPVFRHPVSSAFGRHYSAPNAEEVQTQGTGEGSAPVYPLPTASPVGEGAPPVVARAVDLPGGVGCRTASLPQPLGLDSVRMLPGLLQGVQRDGRVRPASASALSSGRTVSIESKNGGSVSMTEGEGGRPPRERPAPLSIGTSRDLLGVSGVGVDTETAVWRELHEALFGPTPSPLPPPSAGGSERPQSAGGNNGKPPLHPSLQAKERAGAGGGRGGSTKGPRAQSGGRRPKSGGASSVSASGSERESTRGSVSGLKTKEERSGGKTKGGVESVASQTRSRAGSEGEVLSGREGNGERKKTLSSEKDKDKNKGALVIVPSGSSSRVGGNELKSRYDRLAKRLSVGGSTKGKRAGGQGQGKVAAGEDSQLGGLREARKGSAATSVAPTSVSASGFDFFFSGARSASLDVDGGVEGGEEVGEEEDDEEDAAEAPDGGVGGKRKGARSRALTGAALASQVRSSVLQVIKKKRAFMRLSGTTPSTSDIGNWGVLAAVVAVGERLSASFGEPPTSCRSLMSRKMRSKSGAPMGDPLIPLTRADANGTSEEQRERQWETFKSAFARPNSQILFHLTNHYALIFGWREWVDTEPCAIQPGLSSLSLSQGGTAPVTQRGESVALAATSSSLASGFPPLSVPTSSSASSRVVLRREILTARRGQRPSAWIEFEECCQVVAKWAGYAMILVERSKTTGSCVPAGSGSRMMSREALGSQHEEEREEGPQIPPLSIHTPMIVPASSVTMAGTHTPVMQAGSSGFFTAL
uniref:Uncharacterized protein n=1 Tax=Chromera velia CCMP2878 TaxID=1169474 RepID=A0A0G4FUP3_9ALVE|eukprot:Cvel_18879.t1-p1 / transcript=Cvel_18879.t1 / gene=Cvel_18879 / organism=Chromera_velia_CCMP2878 / gene_product=hypothetical protein / transcript_product=hypothetical protein / location=Cvel_scaffold1589:35019-38035(+) / protein_length=978 / sequence_SO=supercontig / SO=protein_coding / is_pseudo=false